jgi:hypothetical protein
MLRSIKDFEGYAVGVTDGPIRRPGYGSDTP